MFKKWFSALLLLTLLSAVAVAQDAKSVISDVSKAMGADSLKTVQYSGAASEYAFGQAYNPSLPWPAFKIKTYTRSLDLQTPGVRIDRVLEPIDPQRRGGGLPPAQIALAWLLHKPGITAPIIGATKPHHIDDAVAALSVKLTKEEISTLESVYVPHPVLGHH